MMVAVSVSVAVVVALASAPALAVVVAVLVLMAVVYTTSGLIPPAAEPRRSPLSALGAL